MPSLVGSEMCIRFRNNGITVEWLRKLREEVVMRVHYPTNAERINEYANSGDSLADRPLAKRIAEL